MGTIKRNFSNNVTPTGKFDSADLTGTIPAANVANDSLTNITTVPASIGDFVQKVASDPSPASAGDVWYNTTTNALKAAVVLADAWASGGNLSTARSTSGAGTQTAGLAVAGRNTASPPQYTNATEEYDGASWGSGGNTNTPGGRSSSGTQTAALAAGGFNREAGGGAAQFLTATEEYNGTAWTNNPTGLTTGNAGTGIFGTQTAAIYAGGELAPGPVTNVTQSYDGSSWTTVPATLNTARATMAATGTQTAGLFFGAPTATELWDGSSWTSNPTGLNTARDLLGGAGTQSNTLAFAGRPSTAATELWNGSSWTNTSSMASARFGVGSAGVYDQALAFGGNPPAGPSSFSNATEEFTGATVVTQTVTTS